MTKKISDITLLSQIRELILKGRKTAYRQVNTLQIVTNFLTGKIIVEHEQEGKERAAYGKETLRTLSSKLTAEFGRGFSVDNLQLMRSFYITYQNRLGFISASIYETPSRILKNQISVTPLRISDKSEKSETVSRISQEDANLLKLSWSHFVLLMKMQEDEKRFYEIEAAANNWSVRELQRQYNSSLYERLALSKDKQKVKELSSKGQLIEQPGDLIKQPYILEFLGLKEETAYTESDLETAIINKIEQFLLELGKGFLFEARQKRLTFEGDNFYVDLVFYNRPLRCYVLVDLKIGKLTHQDIGQMQMYVNYFDRMVRLPQENKTVGIVLCKQSNKAVVEFTLPEDQKQIFAREYKLYLPAKEELKKQLESFIK